jgi:hypothetical protein
MYSVSPPMGAGTPPGRPRDQLGVHAAGFFKQHPAQVGFAAAKALRHAGQVPHGLHGRLGDQGGATGREHLAVGLEAAFCMASITSGRITCALVTAMVGLMS